MKGFVKMFGYYTVLVGLHTVQEERSILMRDLLQPCFWGEVKKG